MSHSEKKHLLQNTWQLYLEHIHTDWSMEGLLKSLEDLGRFNTGEDFWNCYEKALLKLTKLDKKESIHLFRVKPDSKSILPVWEDNENKNGGEWTFRVDIVTKKDGRDITGASKAWENLLCTIIGEQFDECLADGDEICGLTISAREKDFVFALWHKNASSSKKEDYSRKIKEVLAGVEPKTLFYKSHVKDN
jgi:hypothetical protein